MSGLDFKVVDVKFTEGQDTKTQPKLVLPGKWTSLINMTLSKDRTPRTRDGHGILLASSAANGNGLALYNDQLLTISGPTVKSFAPTSGTLTTTNNGTAVNYGHIRVTKSEVYASTGFQDSIDCAYGNGLIAYVWRDVAATGVVNGIKCVILDSASGTEVLYLTTLRSSATAATPRVVFADNAFFFIYREGGTDIYCNVVATSAPQTVGAAVSVVTSGGANIATKNIDACANPAGTSIIVPYVFTAGANSINAVEIIRTGTVPSVNAGPIQICPSATIASGTIQGLACCNFADLTHTGIFYITTTAVSGTCGTVIDATTFTVSTATSVIDATVMPVNSAAHVVAASTYVSGIFDRVLVMTDQQSSFGTADFRPIRAMQVNSNLTLASGPTTIGNSSCFRINGAEASGPQGPFLAGKPFMAGSSGTTAFMHVPMAVLENYNQSSLGANTSNPNAQNSLTISFISVIAGGIIPVGHALYGSLGLFDSSLGGAAPSVSTPCSTPSIGNAGNPSLPSFITAQLERRTLQTVQGINITPTGICSLTLSRNQTVGPIWQQLSQSTFLSGGVMTSFDGQDVTEHGFLLYPEGISVVAAATGAGSVTVGTHQMVATYEWTDSAGQRHQSAPSPAVSFTFANATDQANVIIPTLLLSQKSNVTISLWMTEASGTTFYRISVAPTAPIVNTTAASNIAVSIGVTTIATDAYLRRGEILYSEPTKATDALPNIIPGPCAALTAHQNRIWTDVGDTPGAYRYSQAAVQNVGLMFNPSLGGSMPVAGGKIVAFVSMDEKLIIFGSKRPYVVYGTGPRPDGSYANYTDPQEIQSDVGCSDAKSVLPMPRGVIFKSQKGWYLLGRDLEVRYIGEGVSSYDSATVLSAVMLENEQEIRFELGGSGAGITLVYSYLQDQWSVFNRSDGYVASDALWWPADSSGPGNYVTISTFAGLSHDTPGTYYDSGAFPFTISGTSAWLHLSTLEAFQRIRRMFLTMTSQASPSGTLGFEFYFDDSSSAAYSLSVSTGGIYVANMPLDLRHKLQVQKCKSMRFLFSETPTNYNSPRITGIQALALEVGMKRGVNKVRAAQNVG